MSVGNCSNTRLLEILALEWDEIELALLSGSCLISITHRNWKYSLNEASVDLNRIWTAVSTRASRHNDQPFHTGFPGRTPTPTLLTRSILRSRDACSRRMRMRMKPKRKLAFYSHTRVPKTVSLKLSGKGNPMLRSKLDARVHRRDDFVQRSRRTPCLPWRHARTGPSGL